MTTTEDEKRTMPEYFYRTGRNMVNFIKGGPTNEDTQDNNKIINIIKWVVLTVIIVFLIYKFTKKIKKFFRKKKSIKNKKENTYADITTTQSIQLDIPPNNMICSYSFDIDVFFQNSSKAIHTILDRVSPIIKVNMMNGSIIIEYLSSYRIKNEDTGTDDIETDDTGTDDTGNLEDFTNFNLIEHLTESCNCPNSDSNNNNNNDPYPTILRVVTPPIHFQKNNHIEIKQNIRHITVFLNGKFFYSTTIDYVPYLFKGNATLLPDEAWRYIKLKKLNFNPK